MKKIILATALFLLATLIPPAIAHAQGTFTCEFTAPVGEQGTCIAKDAPTGNCNPGYETDSSYCRQFRGQAECNSARPQTCVPAGTIRPYVQPSPNAPTCTTNGQTGIDTAIGCIPVEDTDAFIGFILRWAIGIGGGIAFLLIVYAAFMIMTSQGNPERLKAGQELLTSAIAGLILLIFSIFILRVIGVDILQLPGFG